MFAKQFVFEDYHFDYVRRIFGREGTDLLARTPAFATDEPRSHVHMGDDFIHLMLREQDFEDAFVFIHEFGHLWHAAAHPELSKSATEARCEAAAYETEIRLAEGSPVFQGLLARRVRDWRPDAAAIVNKVPSCLKIKAAIPRILQGFYG